jgi:hypothetical protein
MLRNRDRKNIRHKKEGLKWSRGSPNNSVVVEGESLFSSVSFSLSLSLFAKSLSEAEAGNAPSRGATCCAGYNNVPPKLKPISRHTNRDRDTKPTHHHPSHIPIYICLSPNVNVNGWWGFISHHHCPSSLLSPKRMWRIELGIKRR